MKLKTPRKKDAEIPKLEGWTFFPLARRTYTCFARCAGTGRAKCFIARPVEGSPTFRTEAICVPCSKKIIPGWQRWSLFFQSCSDCLGACRRKAGNDQANQIAPTIFYWPDGGCVKHGDTIETKAVCPQCSKTLPNERKVG